MLRSCLRAKTVRRVVFTSSAGTVVMQETRKSIYEDDSWSDVEFCRAKKMTGWVGNPYSPLLSNVINFFSPKQMYFVSKTLAEQAAWDFAEKNEMDFVSIIPTLVNGPFIVPAMPPSMLTALALILSIYPKNQNSLKLGYVELIRKCTGNEPHYFILNPAQFVHLDDLCDAHIFLLENPNAKGRYICSSHDVTITKLANMLKERYPELDVPAEYALLIFTEAPNPVLSLPT